MSVPEVAPVVASVVTGLRLPGGQLIEAQEVGRNERVLLDEQVHADALGAVFGRVHDRELFGQQVTHIDLDPSARTLTLHVASDAGPAPFDAAAERQRAVLAAAENPGRWRVLIRDEDRRRVVAMVPVPALGWTAVTAVSGLTAASQVGPEPGPTLDSLVLDNGLVEISLRPDGALRLESRDGTVLDGVGQLVDGGDCGDSYSYGPPSGDLLVTQPDEVSFRVLERGQVRSVLEISRHYTWPARLGVDGTRSAEVEPVLVTTRVELVQGEPFARLHLTWENRSSDHRLRLHVPLDRASVTSHAEGQFAVVERGLRPEGGSAGEYPIPTYPASGFVDAGGAAVLLTRTVEYELLEGREDHTDGEGSELAITLLRAVGLLSRNVHPYRDEPAGPQLETPAAQCLGPAEVSLAVMPHDGSWLDADLVAAAERYRHPMVHRPGTGALDIRPSQVEGLSVQGTGVAMTSLRRRGDWLELRLGAQTSRATTAVVGTTDVPVTAARTCDLLGGEGQTLPVEGGVLRLPMRPWQIMTVQLRIVTGLG